MYGKIFSSMYKGSLYGQWEAIVTFTVMISLADQHGEVDMTPEALAATTSIPLDIIRKGLAVLEQPDPKSRTPDEDGRRITRVSDHRDWGWRITNYAHYRAMRSQEERREYMRQYKRDQRAREKQGTKSTTREQLSTKSTKAVSSKQEAEASSSTARANANAEPDGLPVPPACFEPSGDPVRDKLADTPTGAHAVAAYDHFRSRAHSPHGVAAELDMLAQGGRELGTVPWAILAQALHEFRLTNDQLSSRGYRAFVKRLMDEAKTAKATAGRAPDDLTSLGF